MKGTVATKCIDSVYPHIELESQCYHGLHKTTIDILNLVKYYPLLIMPLHYKAISFSDLAVSYMQEADGHIMDHYVKTCHRGHVTGYPR